MRMHRRSSPNAQRVILMCTDGMGVNDRAVSAAVPASFHGTARQDFDLTDDSWNPAGAGDPGNGKLPYGKMISAVYLMRYGLRDDSPRQHHSTDDYRNTAQAYDTNYHGPFYTRFGDRDGSGEAVSETGRFAAHDRITFHCPIFDNGAASDDPANRASVFVHEGWHHWQYKYGYKSDHLTGGAIAANLEGDYYYRHGASDFPLGMLWTHDEHSTPLKFHSPYQVMVEFDADLSEVAAPWVPASVRIAARSYGNKRLRTQFYNRVFYTIGRPQPFRGSTSRLTRSLPTPP